MAEYQFYPLGITAENAKKAIDTAAALAETPGVIYADGSGNVRTAEPGTDYGFPVLYGIGVPNEYTLGSIGQQYFDMAAKSPPYVYVCVDYTNRGYQWKVLGNPGDSFVIYGYYQTLTDLKYGVSNPTPGVAYGVGTAAPYTIYVYDGVTNEWVNNGTLGIGGTGGSEYSIPAHGATGQVLTKKSNASGVFEWKFVDVTPPDGSVTAAKIGGKAVVEAKYADASIPVRAFKDASIPRSKLAQDALYSPVVTATESTAFTANDGGKTFFVNGSTSTTEIVLRMSKFAGDALPVGTEIAVLQFYGIAKVYFTGARVVLTGEEGVKGGGTGDDIVKLGVNSPYGMIALKKLNNNTANGCIWLVTGNVEVVS